MQTVSTFGKLGTIIMRRNSHGTSLRLVPEVDSPALPLNTITMSILCIMYGYTTKILERVHTCWRIATYQQIQDKMYPSLGVL